MITHHVHANRTIESSHSSTAASRARRRVVRGAPLLLVAGALVAACSAAPDGGESLGSTSEGITQSGVFTSSELQFAEGLTDLWGSALPFSNGQLDFIPSPCGSVNLGSLIPSQTVALPTSVIATGNSLCSTYTASITGLAVSSLLGNAPFGGTETCPQAEKGTPGTLTLTPSGVQANVALSGSIHLMAGTGGFNVCPSGDVNISSGSITALLVWNAAKQQFTATVTSQLNYNVANCWDGICNGIMAGGVGDLNGKLGTQLTNTLNAAFANPTTASGIASSLYQTLGSAWNYANGIPKGSLNWGTVIPGSVQYSSAAGGEFTFSVSRTLPPGAPGCTPSSTCSNEYVPPGYGVAGSHTLETVTVGCQSTPTAVQQLINGSWVNLPGLTPNAGYPSTTTPNVFDVNAQGAGIGSAQSIRACATSAGGTTCDAPSNITIMNCCAPLTCQTGMCGTQADGCGGSITCGGCATGLSCVSGSCEDTSPQGQCENSGGTWVGGKCIKAPPPHCGGKLPACQ